MWIPICLSLGFLGSTLNILSKSLLTLAFLFSENTKRSIEATRTTELDVHPNGEPYDVVSHVQETRHEGIRDFSFCLSNPSLDSELKRMCVMAADHMGALYSRLSVEYEVEQQLSPEEFISAISEGLNDILAEEDHIADLVIERKLPHGALPVRSLKQAIQTKLEALNRLKPKNITTKQGLMGLRILNGKLEGIEDCVEAQVMFFYDLMGAKFKLAKMTNAEVQTLVKRVKEELSGETLQEKDLPLVLEVTAKEVMDEVAAEYRTESLRSALQSMAPLVFVGDDDGLTPLSPSRCLTLVRGLFPTLRAHMTLHYEMKDPTETQLQDMADVLLPLVNAHRSRLRLSAQKGITLLAPEEHTLFWGYMEQYAREHKLVGKERPLNLWRFPIPAGAGNLLD